MTAVAVSLCGSEVCSLGFVAERLPHVAAKIETGPDSAYSERRGRRMPPAKRIRFPADATVPEVAAPSRRQSKRRPS